LVLTVKLSANQRRVTKNVTNKENLTDKIQAKIQLISGHSLTLVIKIIVLMTQKSSICSQFASVLLTDQSEPQGESRQNAATSVTAF
jgi:ACR3 family arsenite efflux pump ArsB